VAGGVVLRTQSCLHKYTSQQLSNLWRFTSRQVINLRATIPAGRAKKKAEVLGSFSKKEHRSSPLCPLWCLCEPVVPDPEGVRVSQEHLVITGCWVLGRLLPYPASGHHPTANYYPLQS